MNKYKQIILHSQEINFICYNGNYLEQFNLSPLATTDTEVASLKFHLTADAWEYPDWALFESFSPTTGDDLQLVEPAIRTQLEQVQRVEFASSPPTGGPYQYLCLRHNPYTSTTERIGMVDKDKKTQ